MIYLQSLSLKNREAMGDGYPFSLPLVRNLTVLRFGAPVTFFVGENGTGKSTILEAVAAAMGAITVGGEDVRSDPSLAPARQLAQHLTLTWSKKSHRGFFLRAEDFFNFGARMAQLVRELDAEAASFEGELSGYGLQLAQGAVRGQRAELVRNYGEDLNARSHGESFLQLFQARFVPGGIYLLDEPDTALSPQRQLALLAMLKDMVAQEAQFIIATHSPIVLAFPGASILAFDGEMIDEIAYDAVENVVLTRSFLANPRAFLRHL
jgi:predicted ATPase